MDNEASNATRQEFSGASLNLPLRKPHGRNHVKKFVAIFALLTAVVITPVFAQSFDPEAGTGNVLPSYYGADGALHTGAAAPPQTYKTAERRHSSHVYAATADSARGTRQRQPS
jgi:hypothetical protein